ncbi:Uncharacterized protein pbN1_38240 [Aromatoleum bremense]|nr:Uncharacterized protein pbN1_38240 [Aromatoleum bremense]
MVVERRFRGSMLIHFLRILMHSKGLFLDPDARAEGAYALVHNRHSHPKHGQNL